MLFQNLSFFLLCAVTFALYWRVPKARLWVLAAANALFYVAAGWENLCLFLGASAITYALGQHVTGPRGRWAMWAGIVLNVANLAFFKYAGFAVTNMHALWPVPLPEKPCWCSRMRSGPGFSWFPCSEGAWPGAKWCFVSWSPVP